jgi:hypothetical protein
LNIVNKAIMQETLNDDTIIKNSNTVMDTDEEKTDEEQKASDLPSKKRVKKTS